MENKSKECFIDKLPSSLRLMVKEGESLSLSLASLRANSDSEIIVDVQKDGRFVGAFADFCSFDTNFKITVNLLAEGASCEWHLASLSSKKEKKCYETNVNHLAPKTTASVSNYGIAREESFLKFHGSSFIQKGAKGSNTRQEAKIIVFDPLSDGLASPALQIDENDVSASHAAVVGRLNEQHLFYLESRGIDLVLAKRLIALGYLKPIEAYFDDEKLRDDLDSQIERGF